MVDADLGSPGGGAVVVEEATGDVDAADPVEFHGERISSVVSPVEVDGDDGAERSVAYVGVPVAFDVEGTVRSAGGDAVPDGEGTVAARRECLVAEFAIDTA